MPFTDLRSKDQRTGRVGVMVSRLWVRGVGLLVDTTAIISSFGFTFSSTDELTMHNYKLKFHGRSFLIASE